VRRLVEVTLIHKSDISFNLLKPKTSLDDMQEIYNIKKPMNHGEMYIYQDNIYFYNGLNWYKANIYDIKEIKSLTHEKQILIHFINYDLLISCDDFSHLQALRDFLNLYHDHPHKHKDESFKDDLATSSDRSEGIGGLK
jgi:hypothetical protein